MKRIILLCMVALSYMASHAQATDLVIDNQTPGWLSSKINYGDQLTVKNLKVTGYINTTDLRFIGSLIKKDLHGRIDLSAARIVSEPPLHYEDDCLHDGENSNCFAVGKDTISTFIFPESLKKAISPLGELVIDTVYFNCDTKYIKWDFLGRGVFNHLYVGNKIDSIPEHAMFDWTYGTVRHLKLSENVWYIGTGGFTAVKDANIKDLKELTTLGKFAFSSIYVDTLYVPEKLSVFFTSSVRYNDFAHIFVPSSITKIDNTTDDSGKNRINSYNSVIFHMESSTPPTFTSYKINSLSNSIVYVPHGASYAYKNADGWKSATIIEMNPVREIVLNEHELKMDIGTSKILNVSIIPVDADDNDIIWESENKEIASVDENGTVEGISSGVTYICAYSSVNPYIKDSCKITVIKHVERIYLSDKQIELRGLGTTMQLIPTVEPDDATDKSVVWSSSDGSVCYVTDNGTVIAMGEGTAVVLALTNDGNLPATCVVTVSLEQTTGVAEYSLSDMGKDIKVYGCSGKQLQVNPDKLNTLPPGVYVVKYNDKVIKIKL